MNTTLKMSLVERLELLGENVRRMFRTGAQATLTGLALSDVTLINAFDFDLKLAAGFFGGGCIIWILMTLAAPPKD